VRTLSGSHGQVRPSKIELTLTNMGEKTRGMLPETDTGNSRPSNMKINKSPIAMLLAEVAVS
jgi:hypothetical protein